MSQLDSPPAKTLTLLAFAEDGAYFPTNNNGLWALVDIDGDGKAEIMYRTVVGSSTLWYAMVRYHNERLVQVVYPDGNEPF